MALIGLISSLPVCQQQVTDMAFIAGGGLAAAAKIYGLTTWSLHIILMCVCGWYHGVLLDCNALFLVKVCYAM